MSTVAYRDGVLCADRQAQNGSIKRETSKMMSKNGASVAWVGNWVDGYEFALWWFAGADRAEGPKFIHYGAEDLPRFSALAMPAEGGCLFWTEHLVPEPVHGFMAIGSGQMAAMAAMQMGADAIEAVRIAHGVDPHTGFAQDVFAFTGVTE